MDKNYEVLVISLALASAEKLFLRSVPWVIWPSPPRLKILLHFGKTKSFPCQICSHKKWPNATPWSFLFLGAIDLHFFCFRFLVVPHKKRWDVRVDVSTCFQKKQSGVSQAFRFPGNFGTQKFLKPKKNMANWWVTEGRTCQNRGNIALLRSLDRWRGSWLLINFFSMRK